MTIDVTDDPLTGYQPLDGVFDEMLGAAAAPRDHWRSVGDAVKRMGSDDLRQLRDEADRMIEDDGVSYNVIDEQSSLTRWRVDPLPLVMSADEWTSINRGVIQRAELLNLILTDLYGPRRLFSSGLLPPELILSDPSFLRAADGITLPGAKQLFTTAADVGRDSHGNAWVLADRTQAPSGAGYALENRVVVSRVMPQLYRASQVQRLAGFFRSFRASLQAAAPKGVDNPRIVVMTPGPWSETAFEHAFLASYLGYPLVQGEDLVVRDGQVWMRSLGRPEPVHVILRRVDDWFCDPLELRPDSQLGVPGLVEACRRGTVTIVNGLGSGIVENPALLPYLPRLCEHLLGEPLALPSVPTWWCGDAAGRSHVLSELPSLVIKPVDRRDREATILGWDLSTDEIDDLRRRITAEPYRWVGQETLSLSTVPTITDHGLEARRFVLRTYAVARHDSYVTLPGGLSRVAPSVDSAHVSSAAGSIGKDTWVLANDPESAGSFWATDGPLVDAVAPGSMSARAAENLFWLARYAERAEDLARLLRVVGDRRNDFQERPHAAGHECLRVLLRATSHVTATFPGFLVDDTGEAFANPDRELSALTRDDRTPGSLAHSIRRLIDASLEVRDQLSGDTWIVVGALERDLDRMTTGSRFGAGSGLLRRTLTSLLALSGLEAESMERDPGWRFMDIGRRIERGVQLASLMEATLGVAHDPATDSLIWESVLTAAESILTYRRRYRSHAQMATLLDLLLLDEHNPRSVAFQVQRLAADLDDLAGQTPSRRRDEAESLVGELQAMLRSIDTERLAEVGPDGERRALVEQLHLIVSRLQRLADVIDAAHFSHLLPQHSVFQVPGPAQDAVA